MVKIKSTETLKSRDTESKLGDLNQYNIEQLWNEYKNSVMNSAIKTLGTIQTIVKNWMSKDTLAKIRKKTATRKLIDVTTREARTRLEHHYRK